MRFVRDPFENKTSSFLLNAVIKHHLKSLQRSEVVEELSDNLHIDDWLPRAVSI